MRLNKTTLGVMASFLVLNIVGCAQTDKDLLAEAQYCLDKATKETAAACISKISSINSPQAHALRCAQGFITAGVTSAQNLSDAVTAIQGGTGATAMLAAISFPDIDSANTTHTSCASSGQGGLALIGAMAKSATVIGNLAGGAALATCSDPSKTAQECQAALAANITEILKDPSGAEAGEIADAVGTVYDSTCSNSSTSSSEICTQINSAATAAGVDPSSMTPAERAKFAEELLTKWKQ